MTLNKFLNKQFIIQLYGKSTLLKNFSVYTLTTILNQGIAFLLLPILTYYLSPEDYGVLSLITVFIAFLTPLISVQSQVAISVEYFKKKYDDFSLYFSSAFINSTLIFLLFQVIFLILARWLSTLVAIPPFWIAALPLIVYSASVGQFILAYFRVREQAVRFGAVSTLTALLNIGLSLLFVIGFNLSYNGRMLGIFMANFIAAVFAIIVLARWQILKRRFVKLFSKDALLFGIPLIPHAMGAIVMSMSDRLFIENMVGLKALGLYSVGYAIGNIINLIQTSFMQAWTPFLYKKLAENSPESKRKIVSYSLLYMFLIALSTIALIVITPLIFRLLNKTYTGSMIFVTWVALGFMFLGFYKVFVGFIMYYKENNLLMYLSVFNILLNLGLNYVLILWYGALGAAYATMISYLAFFVIIYVIVQKRYPMPWWQTLVALSKKVFGYATGR